MIPELHFPWLECSILLPILGSIACGLLRDPMKAQRIAVICSGLTLFCTTGEWLDFSMLNSFEAHDHWDFVQWLFHKDIFVIDELSAPLLPLSALLYLMTALAGWRVWQRVGLSGARAGTVAYSAQLALNLACSFLFFGGADDRDRARRDRASARRYWLQHRAVLAYRSAGGLAACSLRRMGCVRLRV